MLNIQKLILAALFLLPLASSAESLTGIIADVHDGDTLTMRVPGDTTKYKIRLLGVDTPEVSFFEFDQGESAIQARDYLRSLAPVGATATILYEVSGMDKHDRILGRVIVDSVEVNREMLENGWGYLYFIFPFNKKIAMEYSELAKIAVEQKRGLFSETYQETIAPYEFRLKVRNQVGKNPVGDLETKKLYSPDDSHQVPVWRRVFFPDSDLASQNGYKY
ncbi:thermonuclease family protein [Bdellovibrio sp. HCB337]|uniref:thermonuclease family protein n=1 Tax=Bdellovibrio sp. HCB337 TaxID=3394358 RepID=UPI0039A5D5B1